MQSPILNLHFIIALVIVMIIAPISGYSAALAFSQQNQADKYKKLTDSPDDFYLKQLLVEAGDTRGYPTNNLNINSRKTVNEGWQLIDVYIDDDKGEKINTRALVSLFAPNQGPVVINAAGEGFPYPNMSNGLGVPYEVIDEIQKHQINHQELAQ